MLTGGRGGPLDVALRNNQISQARARLATLSAIFGDRLYVELQRHGIQEEAAAEGVLVDLAYELGLPLVATNDVRFAKPEQHQVHDVLMCIANSAGRRWCCARKKRWH